jgi:hypothetical protein
MPEKRNMLHKTPSKERDICPSKSLPVNKLPKARRLC